MAQADGQVQIEVTLKEDDLKAGLNRMEESIRQVAARGQNIFSKFGESIRGVGQRFRETGETMVDMGDNLSQGLSLPFILVGGVAAKAAGDFSDAMARVQARLGDSEADVSKFGNIVKTVFASGLGDDIQSVGDAVGEAAAKFKKLNPAQLQGVVFNAEAIAKAFGIDAVDAIDKASEITKEYGVSSNRAMDLVAAGYDAASLKGKNLHKILTQVKGKAEEVTGAVQNSAWVQFQAQLRQVEMELIPLGNQLLKLAREILPIVSQWVSKIVNWFNNLSPTMQKVVIGVGAFLIALGPLVTFLGALMMLMGPIVEAFGLLAEGVGLLISPVGLVVLAVAALVAVFVILWNRSAAFRQFWITVWNGILNIAKIVWNNLMGIFNQAKGILTQALNVVAGFINQKLAQIRSWWQQNGAQIMAAVRKVWGWIAPFISAYMTLTEGKIKTGLTVIKDAFKTQWDMIKTTVKVAWDIIKGYINANIHLIEGIIKVGTDIINGNWRKAWNDAKATARNIWNDIKSTIKSIVLDLASGALQWGRNLVHMFADGIRGAIGAVESAAESVASAVKKRLGFASPTELGPASNSDEWAPNFVKMFSYGLLQGVPEVGSAANTLAYALTPLSSPSMTTKGSVGTHLTLNYYGNDRDGFKEAQRIMKREMWKRGL